VCVSIFHSLALHKSNEYMFDSCISLSGKQNYLPPAMDMAKVGGPLSVVNVFHKIEHPMSTPHYFSLRLILSVTIEATLNRLCVGPILYTAVSGGCSRTRKRQLSAAPWPVRQQSSFNILTEVHICCRIALHCILPYICRCECCVHYIIIYIYINLKVCVYIYIYMCVCMCVHVRYNLYIYMCVCKVLYIYV